jgi:phosphohistidine phosphatase
MDVDVRHRSSQEAAASARQSGDSPWRRLKAWCRKTVRNFPRALPCAMPRVILVRHAEAGAPSSEGDPARRLTAQGCVDAARMGAYFRASGLVFDLALVSPARRACDTLDMILQELSQKPACELEAPLYNADVETLRDLLARTSASVKTLLIVGHNPGLGEFARFLVRGGESAILRHFPAPCLAVIDFSCGDWSQAATGGGRLDRFVNFSGLPAENQASR